MRYVSVFYAIQTNAGCSTFVLTTLNIGKLFSGRYIQDVIQGVVLRKVYQKMESRAAAWPAANCKASEQSSPLPPSIFLSITKPAKLRNTGECYIFVDI